MAPCSQDQLNCERSVQNKEELLKFGICFSDIQVQHHGHTGATY